MNRFIFFLLITIVAVQVKAQDSQAFSLKQAQDYAAENAFASKSTALAIGQAKANVNEAISVGLPQIDGSVDFQHFIELPTSLVPAEFFGGPPGEFIGVKFGTKFNLNAGINARQQLFDPTWIIGVKGAQMFLEKMRNLDKKT